MDPTRPGGLRGKKKLRMQIIVVKPLEKYKAFIETLGEFGFSGRIRGIYK